MTNRVSTVKMNQPFTRASVAYSYPITMQALECMLDDNPIGTALEYRPLYHRWRRTTKWPEAFRGVFG